MRLGAKPILSLAFFLLLILAPGQVNEPRLSEYQLKAAFLFNFAKFVDWPPEAFPSETSPLVIGVLGQNPFGKDLGDVIRNKVIGGHPVTQRMTSLEAAGGCHVLFISSSERKRLREIIHTLQGNSVLTVGDSDEFIAAGGMINLFVEGKKIRFQINQPAAKSAGLKVSSKLLCLAAPCPR